MAPMASSIQMESAPAGKLSKDKLCFFTFFAVVVEARLRLGPSAPSAGDGSASASPVPSIATFAAARFVAFLATTLSAMGCRIHLMRCSSSLPPFLKIQVLP